MKLAQQLFLSAAVVLGFAACSSDDASSSADAAVAAGGQASGGHSGGHDGEGGHATGGTPVGGSGGAGGEIGTGGVAGGAGGGGGGAGGVVNVCPEPAAPGGAGGAGGAGGDGGGGAGGEPVVDPVKAERCVTQCSRLADCATAADPDLCPCYDPAERDALYNGCYESCLGPIGDTVLAIAEGPSAAACEDFVRIINGVNAAFKGGCVGAPPM